MRMSRRLRSQHRVAQPTPVGRCRSASAAFSLVELSAVLLVLSLLTALALPAVQASRESARRTSCFSKLRQIGLAVQSYEAVHKHYPAPAAAGYYSLQAVILPQLEEQAAFEWIDWQIDPIVGPPPPKLLRYVPKVYQCPSDGVVGWNPINGYGGNYVWNWGSSASDSLRAGPFDPGVSSAHVLDGLSQTAMFAEALIGDGSFALRRGMWTLLYQIEDEELQDDLCLHQRYASSPSNRLELQCDTGRGRPWFDASQTKSGYYHRLRPNSPSCLSTVISASSNHPGGINLLRADGSVIHVANQIEPRVWRALGTRAGGESNSL